ncbi:nucleotidyltransferase family protein [Streptomyces sp. NBC_01431]|uniref:nucleotidyltransferase family protein n=1 Tax=Streptomyces sp. NBC_01431 TaxID=2903863 RepID=UPI002E332CC8|nr:nucleotidyltransferase family protein [Streptomyces sp. NBC_01431]
MTPTEQRTSMPPEHELLLTAVKVTFTPDDRERCRKLIESAWETLDWGFLLDQAGRHRVLSLFGKRLNEIWPDTDEPFNLPHRNVLRRYHHANRARNEALLRELETVVRCLADAGVRPALRKGAVLASELYRDLGAREMGDIDLLVDRAELAAARKALASLGYTEGRVEDFGRTLVPATRQIQVYWSLHGNGVHFCRPTGELFVDTHLIELTYDLFLPDSGSSVTAGDLRPHLERHRLNGVETDKLTLPACLLDICADIYLKATTLYYIERSGDLQLAKFVDLVGLMTEFGSSEVARQLHELASRFDVLSKVSFSIQLAAELLDPDPAPDSGLRPFVDQFPLVASELRSYGVADGVSGSWDVPVRERIFDNERFKRVPKSRTPQR